MNWTKLAYHSFLTILLGVTLSVCSNVMETDDFEIEAIANSSRTKHGSTSLTTKSSQTISFSSSFSSIPTIDGITIDTNGTCDNGSNMSYTKNHLSDVTNVSKTGFDIDPLDNAVICSISKLYYTATGN